jgi:hypothetical protein
MIGGSRKRLFRDGAETQRRGMMTMIEFFLNEIFHAAVPGVT